MPTVSRLLTASIFGSAALVLSAVFCTIWLIPFEQSGLFLVAVLFTTMLAFVVSDIFWWASEKSLGALYTACFGSGLAFGVFVLSAFILYSSTGVFDLAGLKFLLQIGGWLVLPGGALAGFVTWALLRRPRESVRG